MAEDKAKWNGLAFQGLTLAQRGRNAGEGVAGFSSLEDSANLIPTPTPSLLKSSKTSRPLSLSSPKSQLT
jgi:hypothetical protein